jgi:hypothetical protein
MSARAPSQPGSDRVLALTARPSLVFESALGSDGPDVVDLRALDTPVSDIAIRNALAVAWRASPTLTVRVDGTPSAQMLSILHALVRREVRFSPDAVERVSDEHHVVALTDAKVPSAALLAMFPVRVRASASSAKRSVTKEAVCR